MVKISPGSRYHAQAAAVATARRKHTDEHEASDEAAYVGEPGDASASAGDVRRR